MISHSAKFVVLIVWAIVIAGGVTALARYEATPGSAAASPKRLDVLQVAGSISDQYTLVMFVHPKCPCSGASIEELARLMANSGSRIIATVVIYQSSRESIEWNRTAYWERASEIPGVVVCADIDGGLAGKSGVRTSGQVLLYDKQGTLRYDGGITAARGHVGDNDGLAAVIAHTTPIESSNLTSTKHHFPVFGCSIFSSAANGVGSIALQANK